MKLQFKLIFVGFVVISVLMAVVGFIQIRTSQRISGDLDTINRLSDAKANLVDPAVHAIGHLSALNEKTLALYYQYAVGSQDVTTEVEKLHREFVEELEELAVAVAAADIDPLVGEAILHIAEELKPVQAIHPIHDRIHKSEFQALANLVNAGKHEEAEQYVLNTISPDIARVREVLSNIEEHLDEESKHTAEIVATAIHDANVAVEATATRILTVGVIASALLALGMAVHIAAQIIAGDYSVRAKVTGKDEIGELAASFNSMTDSLVEAQKLPKNILRSMKDSLFVVDTKGNITEANQAALDALGYKKEELVGAPISKVFGKGASKLNIKGQRSDVIKYVPDPEQFKKSDKK
jgi:PAS domain-containing protein